MLKDKMWLPDSYASKQLVTLNRVVREYDERLRFGRNETNGDWVVFRMMPNGEDPRPVLGFQYDLPTPDHVIDRLRAADTTVFVNQLEEMNAHNRAIQDGFKAKADEATEETAEAWESFLHRRGDTPYHRSLPKKDPKQRG